MARILVTGGAGFIGYHVCRALLKQRHQVLCVDSLQAEYAWGVGLAAVEQLSQQASFRFFQCDLSLPETEWPDFEAPDSVIHLAALPGVRVSMENPQATLANNVGVTRSLLQWMHKQGVRQLIFTSSSSVYGNHPNRPWREDFELTPISPYAQSKWQCEQLIAEYTQGQALKAVCVRPFTVYGPGQRPDMAISRLVRAAFSQKIFPMYGIHPSARDYTYIDDLIDGILIAYRWLQQEPQGVCETFNLGTGHLTSLPELIAMVADLTGTSIQTEILPPQQGDAQYTQADLTKARSLLNYAPRHSLAAGLACYIHWYQTNGLLKEV